MDNQDFTTTRTGTPALVIAGACLCLSMSIGCGDKSRSYTAEASDNPTSNRTSLPKAEPKNRDSQSVEPQVQAEIGKIEAERRAKLLADAQSALSETRNAILALDKADKAAALAALERATGKLDLIVARDHTLALAPVSVVTTIRDLYATVDTVKAAVTQAKTELDHNQVQDARDVLEELASQAEIQVTNLPIATYPVAIKAVVPLIDAGKVDEAKAALYAALNTLVVENYIIPLPRIRAEALLNQAQKLAAKSNRTADDNAKVRSLVTAAQSELQLAEALGYGTKDNYKPLYSQISEVQKETEAGRSGKGLFDKLHDSLRHFKFLG
jgi:hypothetical protein